KGKLEEARRQVEEIKRQLTLTRNMNKEVKAAIEKSLEGLREGLTWLDGLFAAKELQLQTDVPSNEMVENRKILEKIEEQTTLMRETNRNTEEIKKMIELQGEKMRTDTYAGVAAGRQALKNQNPTIFSDLGEGEEEIKIKYRRKARNPLTSHYILATSPGVWRKAVERGTLRIDLQQVRVEDQSPLIQCTRCLGFGHSKRFCREEVDLCSHCGGPHLRGECPDYRAEPIAKDGVTGAPPYRVIQANLMRKRLATLEMFLEATKRKVSIALIQEPYVGGVKSMGSYRGARIYQGNTNNTETVKAAIAILDPDIVVTQHMDITTTNIVVITATTKDWSVVLVSCYFEPDRPVEPYVGNLEEALRNSLPNVWHIVGYVSASPTIRTGRIIEKPGGQGVIGHQKFSKNHEVGDPALRDQRARHHRKGRSRAIHRTPRASRSDI
ncbi:hypothetical protein ACJJTC_018985, partial [Scirpophaga incertulas]